MNDQTSIFRIKKRDCPFVQIDKAIFEEPRLSWKAKGLLGYLLSRPDDWRVILADLVKRSRDGKGAVQSAMKELAAAGYARRRKIRAVGGKLAGETWFIFEEPLPPDAAIDDDGNLELALGAGDGVSRLPVSSTPVGPAAGLFAPTNNDLTKKEGKDRYAEARLSCPHSSMLLFANKWDEWEAFRRKKRRPISEDAAVKQLAMLGTLTVEQAVESIETSIRNDWTGLFPPKSSSQKPRRASFA